MRQGRVVGGEVMDASCCVICVMLGEGVHASLGVHFNGYTLCNQHYLQYLDDYKGSHSVLNLSASMGQWLDAALKQRGERG